MVKIFFQKIGDGNPEFYKLMDLLADKISLKGWQGFRGGLDIEGFFLYPYKLKINTKLS